MMISVVIPTRNRYRMLMQAIDSVRQQQIGPFEIELIVVNDGSTDETATLSESFSDGVVLNVRAGSCAAARNAGIGAATGEWVAFLDDDDAWLPEKLLRFAAAIEGRPSARFLYSSAQVADHQLRMVPGKTWVWGVSGRPQELIHSIPAPSTWMVRRDVFTEFGTFDTTLRRAEERDFMLRCLKSKAVEFLAVDAPLTVYRVRAAADPQLMADSWRDTRTALRRHRLGLVRAVGIVPCVGAELRLRAWFTRAVLETETGSRPSVRQVGCAFSASPVHALLALPGAVIARRRRG